MWFIIVYPIYPIVYKAYIKPQEFLNPPIEGFGSV